MKSQSIVFYAVPLLNPNFCLKLKKKIDCKCSYFSDFYLEMSWILTQNACPCGWNEFINFFAESQEAAAVVVVRAETERTSFFALKTETAACSNMYNY